MFSLFLKTIPYQSVFQKVGMGWSTLATETGRGAAGFATLYDYPGDACERGRVVGRPIKNLGEIWLS
jgi:hypothetical protein